jgi:hypothetical protein
MTAAGWILIIFVMGQPEFGSDMPFATRADCEQAGADWDARKQPDEMTHVCIEMDRD